MDWGAAFFTYAALPPDPAMVGAGWRKQWLERLEVLRPFPPLWLAHQRRDEFWKHGSVCEDYAAIRCPVLGVSGWADGYTAAVFRLAENLAVPARASSAPGAISIPSRRAGPGHRLPAGVRALVGPLAEGQAHGRRAGPDLAPLAPGQRAAASPLRLSPGPLDRHRFLARGGDRDARLRAEPGPPRRRAGRSRPLLLRSPQTTGLAGGEWCAYGLGKVAPEMPLDQRLDDAGSLVFDTEPLEEPLAIVGSTLVELAIAADKPQAMVAVRLSDVAPDGAATRVSYGILNLSHRESHESPRR